MIALIQHIKKIAVADTRLFFEPFVSVFKFIKKDFTRSSVKHRCTDKISRPRLYAYRRPILGTMLYTSLSLPKPAHGAHIFDGHL